MNEFLRNFVMKTIRKMIETSSVPEWEVREYALNWYSKRVLTEEDLMEIEEAYKKEEPVEPEQLDTDVDSTEQIEETNDDTTPLQF